MSWEPYPLEKGSRFDLDLLLKICLEREVVLLEDYSLEKKINRNTRILGNCKSDGCTGEFNRTFRNFIKTGCSCDLCLKSEKTRSFFCIKKSMDFCVLCNTEFELYPITGLKDQRILCKVCRFNKPCGKTNKKVRCVTGQCTDCYDRSILSHPTSVYWNLEENELLPIQVSIGNNTDYIYYDCPDCGHTFSAVPYNIKNGHWCPYCTHTKLCEDIDCTFCIKNRFVHEKSRFFIIGEKNQDIRPTDLFANSGKKYYFQCDTCFHEFELAPRDASRGVWCKFCAKQARCEDEFCIYCHNNKFTSLEESKYFSRKNTVSVGSIARTDHSKYIFDCNVCSHEFEASPMNISVGKWCPYCARRKLCDDYWCEFCMFNRFGFHEKSAFWDYRKNIKKEVVEGKTTYVFLHPVDMLTGIRSFKCDFVCENGHEFQMTLKCVRAGIWCPYCRYKTERKIADWLTVRGIEFIRDKAVFDWCINPKTGKKMRYDFVFEKQSKIIEVDGRQHWTNVVGWEPTEDIQYRDSVKEELAEKHGFVILRMVQDDVLHDRYDWMKEILEFLEK